MAKTPAQNLKSAGLGLSGWIAAAGFGVCLGLAIWYATWGWNLDVASIGADGPMALAAGIVLAVVLGGGLMALLFWSHRRGYDR